MDTSASNDSNIYRYSHHAPSPSYVSIGTDITSSADSFILLKRALTIAMRTKFSLTLRHKTSNHSLGFKHTQINFLYPELLLQVLPVMPSLFSLWKCCRRWFRTRFQPSQSCIINQYSYWPWNSGYSSNFKKTLFLLMITLPIQLN